MFTNDMMIDAVQNSKKTLVNTFVVNEDVKDTMLKFVDAQTDYTKAAAKSTVDFVTTLGQQTVKAFQETAKFDYAKFGEGIFKAYQANLGKA